MNKGRNKKLYTSFANPKNSNRNQTQQRLLKAQSNIQNKVVNQPIQFTAQQNQKTNNITQPLSNTSVSTIQNQVNKPYQTTKNYPETKQHPETYTVFNYKLAKVLLKNNCEIVDIDLNHKERGIVFYFKNNEVVQNHIKMFKEIKEIQKKYGLQYIYTTEEPTTKNNITKQNINKPNNTYKNNKSSNNNNNRNNSQNNRNNSQNNRNNSQNNRNNYQDNKNNYQNNRQNNRQNNKPNNNKNYNQQGNNNHFNKSNNHNFKTNKTNKTNKTFNKPLKKEDNNNV